MSEKFSDFIRSPGTAGPPTRDGISALGFVLSDEVPSFLGKYVRVDAAQTFTNDEKAQGRTNIEAQTLSASLTSLAGLTTAADRLAYTTAANTWAVTTLTPFARTLLDDANASAARTTLGLGSIATQAANNVAITGGSITGISLDNLSFLNATLTGSPAGEFLRGYINGLTLSNNATDASNDIDVAAGASASDGVTPVLMTLAGALTKRLDATWAVGNNQGCLDTGVVGNNTYYFYQIQRSDTGVTDILASLSATSPTLPANYDRKRLLGGLVRASGVNGSPFTRTGTLQSSGAIALTGTSVEISGIPPGASVVNVDLDVSMSASADWRLELGDASSFPASGYEGSAARFSSATLAGANINTAFINLTSALPVVLGRAVMSNLGGNVWLVTLSVRTGTSANIVINAKVTGLTGPLSRVRLSTGTAATMSGSAKVWWEFGS